MTVKSIMKTDVKSVAPDHTLKEVAKLLIEEKVSGVPVLNEKGAVVGVVSEKDVFGAVFPSYHDYYVDPDVWSNYDWNDADDRLRSICVRDVMTDKVYCVEESDPILKVGALMMAHHIHRVPVLKNGKLVGIVTRKDIYRSLLRKALGQETLPS